VLNRTERFGRKARQPHNDADEYLSRKQTQQKWNRINNFLASERMKSEHLAASFSRNLAGKGCFLGRIRPGEGPKVPR
jgi:hypothetical protein